MRTAKIRYGLVRGLCVASMALAPLMGSDSHAEPVSVHPFMEHLDALVPVLLATTSVPGVAIVILEDGRIAADTGFGSANLERDTPVDANTVFNVGSIAKTVSAWGVMRLVERGDLGLDEPVSTYLPGLLDAPEGHDISGVTTRRLLSHTAGLSLPSVPEYAPQAALPSLEEAIRDAERGVQVVAPPGSTFAYSGGGYMVLQRLVERVSGVPFAAFMKRDVLGPLGMSRSAFAWDAELLAHAATGYDGDGQPVPYSRYVGQAAASLNASALDLARFLVASLSHNTNPVVSGETLQLMQSPAPNAVQRFGLRYGLGYDLWNLSDGLLVGHNGQNTGWAAAAWVSPGYRAGIVVLTNHSDGMDVWRWVLCDWVRWRDGAVWRGLCTNRPETLPASPEPVER